MNKYVTTPCPKCDGTGEGAQEDIFNDKRCVFCRGIGFIPNDDGNDILELIANFNNVYYAQYLRKINK